MYKLEFVNSILSQKKFCQNFENAVKLWENDLIFMRKPPVFNSNELYEFQILLWIDWLQRKLYTDFWLALSALCDAFHDVLWFYLLLFWSNLTGVLNFKTSIFAPHWFGLFYTGISKICTFLSMSHTICAGMLIICCTLFSEAVFLFSIRFLTFWWFLMRLRNFVYRTFQLVELLLEFAARGGVLALAITWSVTWPTTELI